MNYTEKNSQSLVTLQLEDWMVLRAYPCVRLLSASEHHKLRLEVFYLLALLAKSFILGNDRYVLFIDCSCKDPALCIYSKVQHTVVMTIRLIDNKPYVWSTSLAISSLLETTPDYPQEGFIAKESQRLIDNTCNVVSAAFQRNSELSRQDRYAEALSKNTKRHTRERVDRTLSLLHKQRLNMCSVHNAYKRRPIRYV